MAEYFNYSAFRVFSLKCLPIDIFVIFVSRSNALNWVQLVVSLILKNKQGFCLSEGEVKKWRKKTTIESELCYDTISFSKSLPSDDNKNNDIFELHGFVIERLNNL